jgi:hypothetical protein
MSVMSVRGEAEQEAMIADLNKCNQREKHPKGGIFK